MTEVWYCDIKTFSEEEFYSLLRHFTVNERQEIFSFKQMGDRLFRLMGRWIIYHVMQKPFGSVKFSANGKPYVDDGRYFNVSHAGTIVTVAFSDSEVGVDIEELRNGEFSDIIREFHIQEQDFLASVNPEGKNEAFFKIWTRKEAFLKAIGLGISKGMSWSNGLCSMINYGSEEWYIQSYDVVSGYTIALCQSKVPCEPILFKQLDKQYILDQDTFSV
ncbi:MAG: 4'-phosphopantetheinyl transferase superfamily protein [Sediminibacterium sp.]|nr:4'-phosphopantetheinyl transferase superfamily protein [Sediminibacterium sp.]